MDPGRMNDRRDVKVTFLPRIQRPLGFLLSQHTADHTPT